MHRELLFQGLQEDACSVLLATSTNQKQFMELLVKAPDV